MKAGQHHRARSILRGLFILAPQFLVVRIWLARVSILLWETEQAEEALRADDIDRLSGLGFHSCRVAFCHIQLEDYVSATRYLLMSLQMFPYLSHARRLLIVKQFKAGEGDLDAALTCFGELCDLQVPARQRLESLDWLINAFAAAGRKDVRTLYEQVLDLDPLNGVAYAELIRLKGVKDISDPLVVQANKILACPEASIHSRLNIHLALSGVHAKRGDYAKSFAHLARGKQMSCHLGDRVDDRVLVEEAQDRCRIFTKELVESLRPYGCLDQPIVCIVGMPRSGTSLVHQLLSQCPGTYGAGERMDFFDLARVMPGMLQSKKKYPDCCLELRAATVAKLARKVRERLHKIAGQHACVITKLPKNFWELGLISVLFPDVRIIHCRRSPADTCLSCFEANFADVKYANDLESLYCMYRQYCKLMMHWGDVLPASSLHEVNYEELVNAPEQIVRELCEFAGLKFTERCFEFHQHGKSMPTASRWQVRQPIYQTSVNRSSHYREFLGPIVHLESPSVKRALRCLEGSSHPQRSGGIRISTWDGGAFESDD